MEGITREISGDVISGEETVQEKENVSVEKVSGEGVGIISEETSTSSEPIATTPVEEIPTKKSTFIIMFEIVIFGYLIYQTFITIQENGGRIVKGPTQTMKYCKELPFDDITPGQASFIKSGNLMNYGNSFGATLMNFQMKGILDFVYVGNEKNFENACIKLLDNEAVLTAEEKPVYNFLKEFARMLRKEDGVISLNVLQRYLASGKERTKQLKAEMKSHIVNSLPCYDKNADKKLIKATIQVGISIVFIILMIIFQEKPFNILSLGTWIYILSSVNVVHNMRRIVNAEGLDQDGLDYREELQALERYMKVFSSFSDVPELSVWGYYSMFAMAFGIAPTVLKQIVATYPSYASGDFAKVYEVINHIINCKLENKFLIP